MININLVGSLSISELRKTAFKGQMSSENRDLPETDVGKPLKVIGRV